ncbi:CRISPR-associated protein, MJ1666 family [Methanocaldococcus sp. FS406-22]|uniref:CRISPR-associated CARF protein Csx1 n=1 Tax=Methanocaldococcus sp. (strain FS406-22) TaxID=644281 RepID=UPI0001BF434E|nr:CRISPR-associated CARF protein Csx1 [Methanocaldococcus sp. FS406-22]ADC69276.1 CRISPR-associated protein, MJ1666 family [Methanocaldococcus sp. FS406-22]
MQRILIAPWGNFVTWKEVIYSFDGIEKESKSSISAICEKINPDKVYILVLDTLSNLESENYEDIVKEVKEKTESFIKENLNIDNYEIIVCPGVGTFPNGKFYGNLVDYYSFALYELSKRFDGDLEVHLDLTHGLNYMPVLTYRVVKDLLEIQSIKNKVRLVVYNSDPYVGREKETLNIHIVENKTIIPSLNFDGVTTNFLNTTKFIDKKDIGKIMKEINQNKKIRELKLMKQNINAFLASLVYALPLVYSTFFVDEEKINDKINEIISFFISNIKIDTENKELKRYLKFEDGFNALVKAYFTSKICKIPELIKDELSLKEIEELKNTLFKENPNAQFIKNEIASLYNIVNTKYKANELSEIIENWIPMYKFRREGVDKFNIRNFLAHAGFEKSVTEIYISAENKDGKIELNEKTSLRYNKDYIEEKDGIKRFVFKYKDKNGRIEEINILEKIEEIFLNK